VPCRMEASLKPKRPALPSKISGMESPETPLASWDTLRDASKDALRRSVAARMREGALQSR
jgi:hypothetical protein